MQRGARAKATAAALHTFPVVLSADVAVKPGRITLIRELSCVRPIL